MKFLYDSSPHLVLRVADLGFPEGGFPTDLGSQRASSLLGKRNKLFAKNFITIRRGHRRQFFSGSKAAITLKAVR